MLITSYVEYKQATNYFILWTQKVCAEFAPTKPFPFLQNTLGNLEKRVQCITTNLSEDFYSSELWKFTSRHIKYGEKAAELRQIVQNFHSHAAATKLDPDCDKEVESHVHFLEQLKVHVANLKKWYGVMSVRKPIPNIEETMETEELSPGFYLLDLHTDSEEESEETLQGVDLKLPPVSVSIPKAATSAKSKITTAAPAKTPVPKQSSSFIEEMDIKFGEFRLEIIFALHDLRTASENVSLAWKNVKSGKRSIFSAVMVTYLALIEIDSLEKRLQTSHPTLERAGDLFIAAKSFLKPNEYAVACSYVFAEFTAVINVFNELFKTYDVHTPVHEREPLIFRHSGIEFEYSERTGPLKYGEEMRFFKREFTLLYNNFLIQYKSSSGKANPVGQFRSRAEEYPLIAMFIDQFDKYCINGVNTLTLSFAAYCWITSVRLLEDQTDFLSKTVYLCRHHGYVMKERITNPESTFKKVSERLLKDPNDEIYRQLLKQRTENIFANDVFLSRYDVFHHNPYLTAATLLNVRLNDARWTALHMQGTSNTHTALSHFYVALRKEKYLKSPIIIIETFLKAYGNQILIRDDHERGAYQSTYRDATQAWLGRGGNLYSNVYRLEKPLSLEPLYVSELYRIVTNRDGAGLPNQATKSFFEYMDSISTLTESELSVDRFLSIDLVQYFDLFNCFLDVWARRAPEFQPGFEGIPTFSDPMLPTEYGPISWLLSILDKAKSERTEDEIDVIQTLAQTFKVLQNTDVENYCIFPSSIISIYEEEFGPIFTLRGRRYWEQNKQKSVKRFCMCMDVLEDDLTDALTWREKKQLIYEIKFFAKTCPSMLTQYDTNHKKEFLTILDHFFGNPLINDDFDFIEWIFAMNGYIRKESSDENRYIIKSLKDKTKSHLQIAVLHNNAYAVHLLCTYDPLYSTINFRCQEDGNTALHYAAMKNNPFIFKELCYVGAELTFLNFKNQFPMDLFTNQRIKSSLDNISFGFDQRFIQAIEELMYVDEKLQEKTKAETARKELVEEKLVHEILGEKAATVIGKVHENLKCEPEKAVKEVINLTKNLSVEEGGSRKADKHLISIITDGKEEVVVEEEEEDDDDDDDEEHGGEKKQNKKKKPKKRKKHKKGKK